MIPREVEQALRIAVNAKVVEILSLLSGDMEPKCIPGHRHGPLQPAPMVYEIPDMKITVDIEVQGVKRRYVADGFVPDA